MDEPPTKATDTHRMMICPGCEKEIQILYEYLGLKVDCTLCGKRFKASILHDEKRRSQRADREKAARKALASKKATAKFLWRHYDNIDNSDNPDSNIFERAAHGDLRGHVLPAEGVEDLLDSPEARPPEPAAPSKGERDFHLITIRGKPLWIGVTLAVMALSVVSYLATRPAQDASNGSASLPPRLNRTATAKPTVETNDVKVPKAVAEQYHGLGFSLAQIESAWGIDAGWYWREKKQDESGIGIHYTAANANIQGIIYVVTGLPEDVRTFRVTFSTPLDRWEMEDRVMFFGAPTTMVAILTGCSTEDLIDWISSIVKIFNGEKIFGVETDARICGEFRLTATVGVGVNIGVKISVEPNPEG